MMSTIIEVLLLLTSFRFELYQGGKSQVYYIHDNYYYQRPMGSNRAYSYSEVTGIDELKQQLQTMIDEMQLASLEQTPLTEEDRNRDRWVLEAKYKDGRHIQLVRYTDSNAAAEADSIMTNALSQVFADVHVSMSVQTLVEQESVTPKRYCLHSIGEYSEYTVDNEGVTLMRVDHQPDGVVCGGYRRGEPDATF